MHIAQNTSTLAWREQMKYLTVLDIHVLYNVEDGIGEFGSMSEDKLDDLFMRLCKIPFVFLL